MPDAPSDDWIVLSSRSSWRGLESYSTRASLYALVALPLAASAFTGEFTDDRTTVAIISLALAGAIAAAVFFLAHVLLRRRVRVSMQRGELAVGRRIIPFGSVNRASVGYELRRRKVSVFLMFGEVDHPMASVCVQSVVLPQLDATRRGLVAEVLRQSAVALPPTKPDPYDPKGKFAWMDRPNSLTRDEAIDFVLHTPQSGEPARRPAAGSGA